jgi:hypothetical protein
VNEGLQIQRYHLTAFCCAGLTRDDLGLSWFLGQHKIAMLDLTLDNAAFTDATNAIGALNVNGNSLFLQDLILEGLAAGDLPGARAA